MSIVITWVMLLIVAYLLGSISSAVLVSSILGLPDPRLSGSKNPGATNVLRLGGKRAAMTVLACDVLKGLVAVLLAKLFQVFGFALATVALAAVIGHMYPVFFGFKGGKGVATAAGAIFGLSIWLGLALLGAWLLSVLIWRYSSLSSMIAAGAAPIFSLLMGDISYAMPIALIALLIIFRHLDNIQRLREGAETKLTFGAKP